MTTRARMGSQFRLFCAKISTKLFPHANECIQHIRNAMCVCVRCARALFTFVFEKQVFKSHMRRSALVDLPRIYKLDSRQFIGMESRACVRACNHLFASCRRPALAARGSARLSV